MIPTRRVPTPAARVIEGMVDDLALFRRKPACAAQDCEQETRLERHDHGQAGRVRDLKQQAGVAGGTRLAVIIPELVVAPVRKRLDYRTHVVVTVL